MDCCGGECKVNLIFTNDRNFTYLVCEKVITVKKDVEIQSIIDGIWQRSK